MYSEMKVTDLFPLKQAADQEDRTRRNLLPVRIVEKWGNAANTGHLLKDNPLQVFLGEGASCLLDNQSAGTKAAVLVDFGRELHGNLRLTVSQIHSTDSRARVLIRFGESVMEALAPLGENNTTNDHAVRDHVYDIGQYSTTETNESGFRFAFIRLEEENAAVHIQALHMCFIYRDIPYLGTFSCSDPLLETIWKTAAYTVHLNMQQYLWDGIKRDRLPWQGDMHTEVMTIQSVFGANPVVPKTLDFLRNGTPRDEWINVYSSYSLWWVIVQAEWYRYTGDLEYLTGQREFLKAQLALAMGCVDENGSEHLPAFRFLDWQNVDDPDATHAGLQGIMRLALLDGAFLLTVLGEKEQALACHKLAERMKKHCPACGQSKSAAAILSLAGLEDAGKLNTEVLSPGGAHGYSTFMGYYLLAAKAAAGDLQGALDDLRSYWGGMLQMGATSFWEDFNLDWMDNAGRIDEIVPEGKTDIHGSYGAFCYRGFRHSLCHGWSSGPVPFLSRYVLGIRIEEPGCRRLRISPCLGDLAYAEGTFPTPYGLVSVSHTREADGTVRSKYTAPEGIDVILGEA